MSASSSSLLGVLLSTLMTTPSWTTTTTTAAAAAAASAFVIPYVQTFRGTMKLPVPTPMTTLSNTNNNNAGQIMFPTMFPLSLSLSLTNDENTTEETTTAATTTATTSVVELKSLRSKLGLSTTTTTSSSPILHRQMRPWVVGHRGALYDELENTIESFQRCIQLGCDAIELDVFLLHDGTLIVFHGGRGGDLTDYSTSHPGLGILNLETYEETQTIQFNPDFDEFGCSPHIIRQGRIPTLKEVLLIAKRSGIIVKIELKGPGVTRPVLQLVQELDMVDQCHYSSFDHEQIALVRELHPERITDNKEDGSSSSSYRYKTGALFDQLPDDFIDQALRVGASEVHLKYDTCTPSVVNAIHTNGMDSMIWMCGPIHMRRDVENKYLDVGNEDETMYATLLETGVRQMCVNRPDVLLNMLSRKG